jgi:hypothetical protein
LPCKPNVSLDGNPIRLRQHGTLFSFSQKNSLSEFFCEKALASSALPEAKLPDGSTHLQALRGGSANWAFEHGNSRFRLLHGKMGRFAVFAHFVVFVVQTPTA